MIPHQINKILKSSNTDLQAHANALLGLGIEKVLLYLQSPDRFTDVYPEQAIKLLSVFHLMLQKKQMPVERFQDCNVYLVTNVLNSSFTNERLMTELSSSSTFSRSQQSSQHSNQVASSPHIITSEGKRDKVFQKRMCALQTFSGKCTNVEKLTIREPLSFQQMLQLYYTYLKKMTYRQRTGVALLDCYLIENIQTMALRLIEGQRCPNLKYCFQLIIADLLEIQEEVIKLLEHLILEKNANDVFEIYQSQVRYGKQIKFFGRLNKQTIDQSKWKKFKESNRQAIVSLKQKMRKPKYYETERMSVSEFKSDKNFYEYERKQLYNQY